MRRGLPLLVAFALATAAAPRARALDTIGVDEIKAGMTGYGLSVFSGTKIERFRVTVVGILKDAFPGQHMVLARLAKWDDTSFDVVHTGVIAGMSGSPIYLGEPPRLAGALAYGWSFNKEPVCGITPIANMMAEQARPYAEASGAWLPRPAAGSGMLVPVATPLVVCGMGRRAFARLKDELKDTGLEPCEGGSGSGGGGGDPTELAKLCTAGGAVAVSFATGDMEMSAVGTITYVDGAQVVAFGHPFLLAGEVSMPMAPATIDYVVSTLQRAFKLGSPLGTVGRLEHDRQAAVVGRIGKTAPMVEFTARLRHRQAKTDRTFRCKAVDHPFFTPMICNMALGSFIEVAEPNTRDYALHYTLRLTLAGRKDPVVYTDVSADSGDIYGGRMLGALNMLWNNALERARIQKVELDAEIVTGDHAARIAGLTIHPVAPRAGETVTIDVALVRKDLPDARATVTLALPKDLAPGPYVITVVGGDGYRAPAPAARDLTQLIAGLGRLERGNALLAVLDLPRIQLDHGGIPLPNLPHSALGALLPTSRAADLGAAPVDMVARTLTPFVIQGQMQIAIEVKGGIVK